MHVGDGAEPHGNKISDRGAKALAAAFAEGAMPKLERTSANQIGDEGQRRRLAQDTQPHWHWRRGRGGPRGGGWEGRAAGAQGSLPRRQQAFSDGKGRVGGGQGQEERVESDLVSQANPVRPLTE